MKSVTLIVLGFFLTLLSAFVVSNLFVSKTKELFNFLQEYIIFLAKGEKTEESQNKMLTSIMPMQGKISLLGVAVGVWSVMAAMMFV